MRNLEFSIVRNVSPRNLLGTFLIVFGLALSAPANAKDTTALHDAMGDALAHYRQAMFYLRRDAADVAALELESFVAKWAALVTRYGDNPPGVYGNDETWQKTMDDVSARADQGLAAALAGKSKNAGDVLKPIRRTIRVLRQRNSIFLFADCIDEANSAFRTLFRFRRAPPTFTDAAQTQALRASLTATIKWYEKCRDTAPADVANNSQFKRLIADSLFYLDRMWVAIDEKNQLAVVNILRRVVSSDDLLWLRFG